MATVWRCPSANFSDVNSNVIKASPGDTVVVPSGNVSWSQSLIITNKGIFLEGAGYYLFPGTNADCPGNNYLLTNSLAPLDTVITNQISPYAPLIECFLNYNTNTFMRVSGFHFEEGSVNLGSSWNNSDGVITMLGSTNVAGNSEWRIDHCYFDAMKGCDVWVYGWNGLVDNDYFFAPNYGGTITVQGQVWTANGSSLGDMCGDYSWANPVATGTPDKGVYIENCFITNNTYRGLCDGESGMKVVVRYCIGYNVSVQNHGTETSWQDRSGRWMAAYGNNFTTSAEYPAPVFTRGGSGVCFSNVCNGPWVDMVDLNNYRMSTENVPFGTSDGASPWDTNVYSGGSLKVYDSGTCKNANGDQYLVDTTKNWAVNQWVGYSVHDVNQTNGCLVLSNSATTIAFYENDGSVQPNILFNSGDSYQILKVYRSLDQPGVGEGRFLTETPGPVFNPVAWPQEVDQPFYVWNNTGSSAGTGNYASNIGAFPYYCVNAGANYSNGVDPNYIAMQFPDPWTTNYSTNVVSTPPPPSNFTLTVVNGIGGGTYAANSVVSISANETSNQTFDYWSGADIANTNAASTTVTMPASSLTVTAYYTPYPPSKVNIAPSP